MGDHTYPPPAEALMEMARQIKADDETPRFLSRVTDKSREAYAAYLSQREPHPALSTEALAEMVRQAKARYDAMTPEERKAHDEAQRASYVRCMMPTGDPNFD